jgi:hypothetical protein
VSRWTLRYASTIWALAALVSGVPLERVSHAAAPLPRAQGRWCFGFSAIQTVFEGEAENTLDKLRIKQERYGLPIPFGHDVPLGGNRHPSFMEDHRSAGTPWFTVIDSSGQVVFADFRLDADRFLAALDAGYLDIDAA